MIMFVVELFQVETDSVRALYKRSLELDCELKELDCELRRLQIKKIKLEIKQLEKTDLSM
jgi:hypothetical protein